MPDGFLGLSARQVISLSCDHFDETKLSVWVVHLACEMACHNILAPGFGADDASVGIHNDIWFWGNAVPGSVLEAEAVISGIDRKRFVFNVFVRCGVAEIARGQHERLMVSQSKFMDAVRQY